MRTGEPDLLIEGYLERKLTPFEERLLWEFVSRGGAAADRFVELRELDKALRELFGGARRNAVREPSFVAPGKVSEDDRFGQAPVLESSAKLWDVSGRESFRARRFPAAPPPAVPSVCLARILEAYVRWLEEVNPERYRTLLGGCVRRMEDSVRTTLEITYARELRVLEAFAAEGQTDDEQMILSTKRALALRVRQVLKGVC